MKLPFPKNEVKDSRTAKIKLSLWAQFIEWTNSEELMYDFLRGIFTIIPVSILIFCIVSKIGRWVLLGLMGLALFTLLISIVGLCIRKLLQYTNEVERARAFREEGDKE